MKKIIFLLIFIPLVVLSQWVEQQVPTGVGILLSIDFVNANTGVSTGWTTAGYDAVGRAVYTSNGGTNWILASIPDSSRSLVTTQMINSSTGYTAAAYNIIGTHNRLIPQNRFYYSKFCSIGFNSFTGRDTVLGARGFFLKTTNSGQSWFNYGNFPVDVYYLIGMHFINETTGFVSAQATINYWGGRQVIYKTTNGGMNWILSYSQSNTESIRNIYFVNNNTGFAVGYVSINDPEYPIQGTIIITRNGGINWNRQIFYNVNNFTDITMVNSSTGFACGISNSDTIFRGIIYKTTNTGQNWFKLNYQLDTSFIEGIDFYNGSGTGICYGEKMKEDSLWPGLFTIKNTIISKTTDFGNTWQTQFISYPGNINVGSKMLSLTNWYISGGDFYEAKILNTTNGGAIGIEPISSEVPDKFVLFQNYPNPFNPSTKIKFEIPSVGARHAVPVRLIIYDILGREIAVLVNEQLKPGTYEVEWDASAYPSGVYFYRLTAGNFAETKKMVLLK